MRVGMDLSDLLIFKTVAEEGGILRAARKLHRVPSNVTTRIKQLEAVIGTQLFHRDRRRLILSPNGESLLAYADRLLLLAEEARVSVSGRPPRGLLRVGALESTSASRLPAVLARFHRAFPEVRVELRTGTNDALTGAVRERQLDAAFVAETPDDTALAVLPLFREKLVLITARDYPRVTSPRDVAEDTAIAFPNGCAYRRMLERWLGGPSLAARRLLELSSYHAIVACVASGTGFAVVPQSVLATVNAAEVGCHPLPRVLAEVVTPLIWRAGDASPAVMALRQTLERDRKALGAARKAGAPT